MGELSDEGRDAIRASNRNRASRCRKCGSDAAKSERDGAEIGGFPGLKYKVCGACGDSQPIVRSERSKKADSRRDFKRRAKPPL